MAKIVQTTDFKGKYKVSQNSFDTNHFQAFIDKYEKEYLYDLLGVTLCDLFYADIAVSTFLAPVTPIYATLFNIISLDEPNTVRSNGIKEMLVAFIYWEYTRTHNVVNTPTGNVIAQNEVSVQAKWSDTNIYEVYNEGIKTYKSIQIYISDNLTDYSSFKGMYKGFTCRAI